MPSVSRKFEFGKLINGKIEKIEYSKDLITAVSIAFTNNL